MGWIDFDPDEYEIFTESRPCSCGGECNGHCNASFSQGLRRRSSADIARIKAERLRKHEDDVLAEADRIRAKRG